MSHPLTIFLVVYYARAETTIAEIHLMLLIFLLLNKYYSKNLCLLKYSGYNVNVKLYKVTNTRTSKSVNSNNTTVNVLYALYKRRTF